MTMVRTAFVLLLLFGLCRVDTFHVSSRFSFISSTTSSASTSIPGLQRDTALSATVSDSSNTPSPQRGATIVRSLLEKAKQNPELRLIVARLDECTDDDFEKILKACLECNKAAKMKGASALKKLAEGHSPLNRDRDQSNTPQPVDAFLSFEELVDFVFDKCGEQWGSFEYSVNGDTRLPLETDAEAMKAAIKQIENPMFFTLQRREPFAVASFYVSMGKSGVVKELRDKFKLDIPLQLTVDDVKEVLKMTQATVLETKNASDHGYGCMPPALELVQSVPPKMGDEGWAAFFDEKQADKDRIMVVAGESGSGKSVFSCLAPAAVNSAVLYAVVDRDSLDLEGLEDMDEETAQWKQILSTTQLKLNGKKKYEQAYDMISVMCTCLNTGRNIIALAAAKNALRQGLTSAAAFDGKVEFASKVTEWFGGQSSDVCLEKLTLVLDEGSNLDFGHAIVDSGRGLCARYEQLGLARSVNLILTGTGLDRIQKKPSPTKRQFGSDPKKAFVVMVGQPVLSELDLRPELSEGIREGVYSKVLATNSRMFFRAVYPCLSMNPHFVEAPGYPISTSDRLKSLGSMLNLMDYAVRFYLGQNVVGELEADRRAELLDECFRYHLYQSCHELAKELLPSEVVMMEEADEEIFSIGLARSDGQTSAALKYLACFGMTSTINVSDGVTLEKFMLLHLLRWGKAVMRMPTFLCSESLAVAWPPSVPKGFNYTDPEINRTRTLLLKEDGWTDGGLKALKSLYDKNRNKTSESADVQFGIVFSQGQPRAQGPDVFLLVVNMTKDDDGSVNKESAVLHCYQCKGSKSSNINWKEAWISLGVADTGTASNSTGKAGTATATKQQRKIKMKSAPNATGGAPASSKRNVTDSDRAKYSSMGIEALVSMLKSILEMDDVSIGDRYVVTSVGCTKRHIPLGCKIMWKEALEPTLSVLDLDKFNT